MKNFLINLGLAFLVPTGQELINKDDNDTGNDDLAGHAMLYAAEVGQAVIAKQPIPFPPEILLNAAREAKRADGAGEAGVTGSV